VETVRFHAIDTFRALIVTYLKLGSRDLSQFDLNWTGSPVTIQNTDFPVVMLLVGQNYEVPGVNIVLQDEHPAFHQTYTRLVTIHIKMSVSDNPMADDRVLYQLQNKIDGALYGKGCAIYDFDTPAVLAGKALTWDFLQSQQGWMDLTDLGNSSFLHKSRSVRLTYDNGPIV
jgi:hypothetical protein